MAFKRIYVKGIENVDLGRELQRPTSCGRSLA